MDAIVGRAGAGRARLLRRGALALALAGLLVMVLPTTLAWANPPPPYTVAVSPASVVAGSTGNTVTFQFTATVGSDTPVMVEVPAGWSAPQSSNPAGTGYVVASHQSCKSASVSSVTSSAGGPWTISVNAKCQQAGDTFALTYAQVTAPTNAASYVFATVALFGSSSTLPLASEPVSVVAAAAARMTLTGLATATAGTPQSPTVTLYDEFNNIATGYTGTVQFSSNDPQGVLPAPYTFSPADAGTHTFGSGLTLKSAASITVNVTDSPGAFTSGQTITVNPGPAASLQVSGLHDLTLFEGQPVPKQQFRVEALDQYGNVATGYTGTVKFDGGDYPQDETLPASSTLTNGRGVFEMSTSVIQNDCHYGDIPGNQPPITPTCFGYERVTATDTVYPAITGYQRFQLGAVVTPATYFIAPPKCPDSTNCVQLTDGVILNTDLPVYVDITNVNSDGSINGTMTATGANGVTVNTSVTMAAPEIYLTGTIVDVSHSNNSAPVPVNLTVTGGQQLGYASAATFNNITVIDAMTLAPISEPPGTVISQIVNIENPNCILLWDTVSGWGCENPNGQ